MIDDCQTAPSQSVCSSQVHPEVQETVAAGVTALSNSTESASGSGLSVLSPPTTSEHNHSSSSSPPPPNLSDILVLPRPKPSSSTRRGLNQEAVCITDSSFVEQRRKRSRNNRKQWDRGGSRDSAEERRKLQKKQDVALGRDEPEKERRLRRMTKTRRRPRVLKVTVSSFCSKS